MGGRRGSTFPVLGVSGRRRGITKEEGDREEERVFS